jgi:hypothetical protein
LTLSPGDEAAIIAVGVGALLAVGAGIFKVAALRGDMNTKWARRVDFAVAALDEKTIAELEQLRDDVEDILPAGPGGFDPAQAIANPAPLFVRAEHTVKYYRARARMEKDLVRLRRLGPVLVCALTGVEIAAAILTVFYGELLLWAWLEACGLIVLGVAVVAVIAATATYAVLHHRLAGGEILAGTGGRAVAGDEG